MNEATVAVRTHVPQDPAVQPVGFVGQPTNPDQLPAELLPQKKPEVEKTTFSLSDAIAYALRNNPRLKSARAAIERAGGQEQVAFAPFLPQADIFAQTGVTSSTLSPGVPGYAGFLMPSGVGTRSYEQIELALQWNIYDFGRTGGRYRQAVARERITELQLARAQQTIEFDVTSAYLDVLLAQASQRTQQDAVRRAEATVEDTEARRKAGVSLREDVLRAEVQLSESREALVVAREAEFNAAARLNNSMGRNAALPLAVVDLDPQMTPPGELALLMETAAAHRPEVDLARQAVSAAVAGRQVAQAEFRPRIYTRASVGQAGGQFVVNGWQEGVGLHVDVPLYSGGRRRGELQTADSDVAASLAESQTILDAISLQVNLAYRGVAAARERIDLSRTAVVQAEESLRLVRVRYRNGNATPTDIVDNESAVTRSEQRFLTAKYTYLVANARLNYAMGQQGALLTQPVSMAPELIPLPRPLPEVKK